MAMLLDWILFLPPWLLLAFLKPERKRRFMSGTFLVIVLAVICYEISEKLDWWRVKESTLFFTNISSFVFGLMPVVALFVFYLTFPNPWLYFGANLILDAFQCFIFAPYVLEKAGLYEMGTMSYFEVYLLQTAVAAAIYFYQKWYEHGMSYDTEAPLERWFRSLNFRQKAR
ncbi:hypothetical protein [Paenibacillus sp. YN15]|uniref:hypothetical protein n=1 Tax=Paenibacillus sp. YN15 TaxID=1742774 RepID=UPI000DCF1523|nr:hypothetical protein [Paenibacillus sp. YN15]RAU97128.1 hypothetical protein DQG13_19370 [Paenibacillus sp. YN15]